MTARARLNQGHQWYQATGLELRNLDADISIEPHDQLTGIEVTLTGTASGLADILHYCTHTGVLRFWSTATGYHRRSLHTSRLTARVPLGTAINISSNTAGQAIIGDVKGDLKAQLYGGTIKAGHMANVELTLHGNGSLSVAIADGNATVINRGTGAINIESGDLVELLALVSSSGTITVGASALEASLTNLGTGSITVDHVRQPPFERSARFGEITVLRIG
ncbi:MAG: hypothetical protein JWN38_766 [Candidatus Saccharibacteria bacterium]|nr:hypothetical protein [Candidatus Saccharibacteria bacterium]